MRQKLKHAKSTLSAFTNDDGFKLSINLLAESSSSGRKIHGNRQEAYGVQVRPRSHEASETIWRLVNAVIEVSKYICAIN